MAKTQNLRFKIMVPVYFDAAQRMDVGNRVVDHIIKRTQTKNADKKGRPFPKYEKTYYTSKDFRIAGKSRSRVDLTLSGDMLAELDIIDHGQGYIELGYGSDSGQADKVEGNVIGSYGGSPNSKKARDFLGIEPKELDKIIEDVEFRNPQDAVINDNVDSFVNAIMGETTFDF